MPRFFMYLVLVFYCVLAAPGQQGGVSENRQTLAQNGWTALFDGESLEFWQSSTSAENILRCWKISDGELSSIRQSDRPQNAHASLLTKKQYSNFELVFDFKLEAPSEEKETNSGVKYFVYPNTELGLEYQLYASLGKIDGPHAIADLYDILPATGAELKPFDEWNSARILSYEKKCEHWLNGIKVLEFERGSEEFRAAITKSKFRDRKNFGELEAGHILLQDHGGGIKFRDIKIKEM